MMRPVTRITGAPTSPLQGRPVLDIPKASWNFSMLAAGLVCGPILFSWDAFFLFFGTTYLTLLVGHSVGMHRIDVYKRQLPDPAK